MTLLKIDNLHASVEGKEILRGVNLELPLGEVHAIMGPNGSGKSTLANVLMGHPGYELTEGTILFRDRDVTELEPDERARAGMFLAFQYPVEVAGVSVLNFLRTAMSAIQGRDIPVKEFRDQVKRELDGLGIDMAFASRNLNEGFSGGEKKRNEILQLALLKPALAVMDETDSGLDIDAIKTVAEAVNTLRSSERSFLVITHYIRILNYLKPDVIHILLNGRIVRTGGWDLAQHVEEAGYDAIRKEFGLEPEPART